MIRFCLTLLVAGMVLMGCSNKRSPTIDPEAGNSSVATVAAVAADFVGVYDGRLGIPQKAIDNFISAAVKEGKDPDEALKELKKLDESGPNVDLFLELKSDGTFLTPAAQVSKPIPAAELGLWKMKVARRS